MKTTLRNLIHLLSLAGLIFGLLVTAPENGAGSPLIRSIANVMEEKRVRVSHARELLGASYKTSVVTRGEQITDIQAQIMAWTETNLPTQFKKDHRRVAQAILEAGR